MVSIKELMQTFKLSYKQARFVQLFKGNATEAAREAGYKQATASGHENLRKPNVMDAIDYVNKAPSVSSVMSKQELIESYTSIARDSTVSEQARLKAMDSIAKIYGLFIDKQLIAARVESYDRLSDNELMGKLNKLVSFLNSKGIELPMIEHQVIDQEDNTDSN